MTLIELPDLIQGSDEWLEQRRGMVTASVVGKLITTKARSPLEYVCDECLVTSGDPCVSRAKNGDGKPIKTMHQARTDAARNDDAPPPLVAASNDDSRALTTLLVAERITGYVDPVFVSNDMLRGQMDEPVARDLYSEHFAPVREAGFMVRREPGWTLGYSPDGLVGDDGLIEIKSRRQKKQLTTILRDEVPPENMPQLQAGLLVSGRKWIDYVSFCGGMPLYRKRVLPDQRWFNAITRAVTVLEQTAADMVAAYEAAVVGLPMTERNDFDAEIQVAA